MVGQRSRAARAVALVVVFVVSASGCALVQRVSVADDEAQATGGSTDVALSARGRFVAFVSEADDLVPDDHNGVADVFVRDRLRGETTRVSVASDGSEADQPSSEPAISADGRYVAFTSAAALDDDSEYRQVYRHDRATGETIRVSLGQDRSIVRGSGMPAISADGNVVAFSTFALDGETASTATRRADVWVRDVAAATTDLVSVELPPGPGLAEARAPAISADGTVIAFQRDRSGVPGPVPPEDTIGPIWPILIEPAQIAVYDRVHGTTTAIPMPPTTTQPAERYTLVPSISGDGRVVAFTSWSAALASGGVNDPPRVYRHDLTTGTTTVVSDASDGVTDLAVSLNHALDRHGERVAYEVCVWDCTGDPIDAQVWVHDVGTATSTLASASPRLGTPDSAATDNALSADGRTLAFVSAATNLVPDDTNGATDVFVRGLPRHG